jgi:3-hydroxyisobutyrate dehydrogenase-like beta-hydroxyacid dehydrogenase
MRIALIGYGEVGKILVEDLKAKAELSVFDINLAKQCEFSKPSLALALENTDIVISAVTADQTLKAAQEAAPFLNSQVFFDFNSAAPHTKQAASKLTQYYVEGAVMAPISPKRLATPILAGGEKAEWLAHQLNPLGFDISPVSTQIGVASATKLCRSIVIKGLEAIMVDCLKASTHYDVVKPVFASLDASYPSVDWERLAHTMLERVETHGVRRSAEMYEAADMVAHAGFNVELSRATAAAQLRGAKK